ncbi:hypothetical protein AVEN_70321-1 [Araneus ventricosus]|uniref:Uncharacterized protein n=1 Tax=Araneus ventricosus TaxID=182803 RepID=A0A4Y1ZTD9_ARAVE|nr:hypothetical protein AVEN_70321-1 [Araneus ventricosus]
MCGWTGIAFGVRTSLESPLGVRKLLDAKAVLKVMLLYLFSELLSVCVANQCKCCFFLLHALCVCRNIRGQSVLLRYPAGWTALTVHTPKEFRNKMHPLRNLLLSRRKRTL